MLIKTDFNCIQLLKHKIGVSTLCKSTHLEVSLPIFHSVSRVKTPVDVVVNSVVSRNFFNVRSLTSYTITELESLNS